MQDNDPKPMCKRMGTWFEENNTNWFYTPPESPDINPIENLWHELKEYLRQDVKPKTKQEFFLGIIEFWETVDINKCRKYIGHLRKVIPKSFMS
uniref:Tc1-like transposase DDE domain-containing protein n=1 Tax=Amphimedon queenslandica TaxID=400682 RepID=A0A1X7SIT5_AMPQE